MIQEVIDYLNRAEHDFGQGFALFCKYSRNEALMSWISRKEDAEKLIYELGKLSQMDIAPNPREAVNAARYGSFRSVPEVPIQTAQPDQESPSFKTYDERRTKRGDLPPEYQAIYDNISEDYKLRRGLHEKMKAATTDKDRADFRERIMETDARIKKGWADIDAYLSKKASEPDPNFKESTYRSYITKALSRENNSPEQIITCKARVKVLLDNGYSIAEDTLRKLKERGLCD